MAIAPSRGWSISSSAGASTQPRSAPMPAPRPTAVMSPASPMAPASGSTATSAPRSTSMLKPMVRSTRMSAASTSPRSLPARSTSAASAAWSGHANWCAETSPQPARCSAMSARRSMPSWSMARASRAWASPPALCSATPPTTPPTLASPLAVQRAVGAGRRSAMPIGRDRPAIAIAPPRLPTRRDRLLLPAGSTPLPAARCSDCPRATPARRSSSRWIRFRSIRAVAAMGCQAIPALPATAATARSMSICRFSGTARSAGSPPMRMSSSSICRTSAR